VRIFNKRQCSRLVRVGKSWGQSFWGAESDNYPTQHDYNGYSVTETCSCYFFFYSKSVYLRLMFPSITFSRTTTGIPHLKIIVCYLMYLLYLNLFNDFT
jgi:hypothetical protein